MPLPMVCGGWRGVPAKSGAVARRGHPWGADLIAQPGRRGPAAWPVAMQTAWMRSPALAWWSLETIRPAASTLVLFAGVRRSGGVSAAVNTMHETCTRRVCMVAPFQGAKRFFASAPQVPRP